MILQHSRYFLTGIPPSPRLIVYPLLCIVTAPHVTDPRYPGARDDVLDLYGCVKDGILPQRLPELIELSSRSAGLRTRAARFIKAAAEILEDSTCSSAKALETSRLMGYTDSLASRLFPKHRKGSGRVLQRFASAVTPDGVVDYLPDISKNYAIRIVFIDPYGAAGSRVMERLLTCASELGLTVTALLDPLDPERYEGLLIEEASAALMVSSSLRDRTGCGRGVHLQRFYEPSSLPFGPGYLKFCLRSVSALLAEASSLMDEARQLHFEAESIYSSAMDYRLLSTCQQALLQRLGL